MSQELLRTVLNRLHESTHDILLSAVISVDGLPIVNILTRQLDADRVATLSAATLTLCSRVSQLLSCGGLQQTVVEGENGQILLMSINQDLSLVCTTKAGARMGLALVQMRQAVQEIKQQMVA